MMIILIGLDPGNKLHLWSVIQNLKRNRFVFLTTHSMEEAEALSDKIIILALGRYS
jgi:ABC-2 type transport system ATP-binding protein